MNKLRFVKLLVFFLTFAIIFGMVLAGNMIYKKSQKKHPRETVSLNLQQPSGSYISTITSSSDILFIFIKGGKKPDRIIAISPTDYSVTADISLY